jgi:hypothetical protein
MRDRDTAMMRQEVESLLDPFKAQIWRT